MQQLVKTICYGGDHAIAVTHCLLALDSRRRLKMRARLTKVLQLTGLYSVTFFDTSFVPVRIEEAGQSDQYTLRLANRDQLVLGDWFDPESPYTEVPTELPEDPVIRIDAATVRYMPDGLMWHFYERHCDIQFETETIPWTVLQASTE